MFTAVFKRKYSVTTDTVNDTVNSKEQEVLNLLRQQTGLNATEIAQKLGKSIPTIKRYLSSLAKQNLIELEVHFKMNYIISFRQKNIFTK